jgi:ABC-type transport system involved in multi-copper enzyme maturation permease subunit
MVLATLAVVVGLADFDRRMSDFESARTQLAEAQQGGRRVIGGFQRDPALRVVRPPVPASILVSGIDRNLAQYWDFGPDGVIAAGVHADQSSLTAGNVGVDLEFVLRVLLGLLAVIIGAEGMARTRHSGALKALLSLPIAPRAVVVGSLIGGAAAIAAAGTLIIGSGLAALGILRPMLLTGDLVLTAVLLWIAAILYGLSLQGAALVGTLLTTKTAAVVPTAMTLWLVATVVSTPVAAAIAERVTPLPARTLYDGQRALKYQRWIQDTEDMAGQTVRRLMGANGDLRRINYEGAIGAQVDRVWDTRLHEIRGVLNTEDSARVHQEHSRARWNAWLGTLVPGALLTRTLTNLANTGDAAIARWRSDTQAYQHTLEQVLFDARPRLHLRIPTPEGGTMMDIRDRAPRPTVESLPRFEDRRPHAATALRESADSLAALALYALLAWIAAVVTFTRRRALFGLV